jgi:hypothetical protein
MARRQFELPSFDVAYLKTTGLEWETLIEGDTRWLLLQERPVAAGYSVSKALVALRIAPGYPEAQLDMVYFHPPLARADGRAVNRLSPIKIDGKDFQQWSRHRTNESPWRSGEDDISTHLVLVDDWLEREFAKG